jgi:hypothetical protein
MYGFSIMRTDDARDSIQQQEQKIAELKKEYKEKYNLDLEWDYDAENDMY